MPSPQESPTPPRPPRDRADACPGVLRLHGAEDGRVARVRAPGGALTGRQARILGELAARLGDGWLGVTSRGNVEVRGLAEAQAPAWAAALSDAGLLPSPRHERVRNIIAGPLSGLDGRGHADVQAWAAELDALLCVRDWAVELSGRFLFVLDDGRGDVAGLGGDVTVVAAPGGRAELRVGGHPRQTVCVPAEQAPRAALAAADAFCAAAREAGTGAWRVRELPPQHTPDVRAALRRAGLTVWEGASRGPDGASGVPAEASGVPAGASRVPAGAPDAAALAAHALSGATPFGGPPPGLLAGTGDTAILSVLPRFGRLTVAQWRLVLPAPDGVLRLTPWRGIIVPGVARDAAGERLRALEDAGFVTRADSPWYGVGACTGLPGCAKSRTDVRSDAAAVVLARTEAAKAETAQAETAQAETARPEALQAESPQNEAPRAAARQAGAQASALSAGPPRTGPTLPVYWSGCERRCGHPQGDWVDVLATADEPGAGSGYRVTVHRTASRRASAK